MDLRREPFRAFFPLGLALGAAGILPWIAFGRGLVQGWPGLAHSLVMTQAFLVALGVGFLGTMLPRRANSAPLSYAELGVLAAALVAIPVAITRGSLAVTEGAFLLVLATLGQYVVRSLRRARTAAPRRPPPSFVLLPLGVALGGGGALLLVLFDLNVAGTWAFVLGRQLAQQGLMLGLLLALAPMLAPIFAHGAAPPDPAPEAARRQRRLHALAGLALAASFPLELYAMRAGLLLRGAVCAVELLLASGLVRPATRPGLHRWFFRFALCAVPLGLVAAGLDPGRRIQLTHVTYVAGLSLVTFAVSAHVTMLHTGADALADRSPLLVFLAGALTLAAAVVRVGAESSPAYYIVALIVGASLWLAAAIAWAAFLFPRLVAEAKS
jgi:hypothetical protein